MTGEICTIDNIWFVLVIGFLTFVLTMMSIKGGWFKKNKVTKFGKIGLFVAFLLVIISSFQERNNNNIQKNKDSQLIKEQNTRDSLVNIEIDKYHKNLFDKLSIAFKKQGLQYDSIKNQIVKLRDSVKTTVINGEPPHIRLFDLKVVDSTQANYILKYEIVSEFSPSYNTNLSLDFFAFNQNNEVMLLHNDYKFLYKNQTLEKDDNLYKTVNIPKNPMYIKYVVRLKGYYFKHDKTKFDIDKFFFINTINKTKTFQYPGPVEEKKLRDFLKRHNL